MSAAISAALDISLVIVPLTLYILFWRKWNAVNLDLVKAVDDLILYDRYGELLINFDPEKIGKAKCLNFFMWGFIRRYLIVVLIVNVQKYPQFQLMSMTFMSLFTTCFIAYFYPYKTKEENRNQIFNEVCIMVTNYHLYNLTDFVSDLETR